MITRPIRRLFSGVAAALLLGAAPATAKHDPLHQSADGLDFYIGVVPKAVVLRHDSTHEEARMHGGAAAPGARHMVVSIFSNKGQTRVTEAQVAVRITKPGWDGASLALEPMTINDAVSYGGFFSFVGPGTYKIVVEARLPGATKPVAVTFKYLVP